MHQIYVGIDNGISGACAALSPNDGKITKSLMPCRTVRGKDYIDEIALHQWLSQLGVAHTDIFVVYEQGQLQPKFGCKTNFAQGYSFGVVSTVLSMGAIPHMAVNPKMWQKDIFAGLRGDSKDTKGASIEFCRRTYPNLDLRASERCRVPHDGIADALCMATWAARQNL
jgi:hypothetical protein